VLYYNFVAVAQFVDHDQDGAFRSHAELLCNRLDLDAKRVDKELDAFFRDKPLEKRLQGPYVLAVRQDGQLTISGLTAFRRDDATLLVSLCAGERVELTGQTECPVPSSSRTWEKWFEENVPTSNPADSSDQEELRPHSVTYVDLWEVVKGRLPFNEQQGNFVVLTGKRRLFREQKRLCLRKYDGGSRFRLVFSSEDEAYEWVFGTAFFDMLTCYGKIERYTGEIREMAEEASGERTTSWTAEGGEETLREVMEMVDLKRRNALLHTFNFREAWAEAGLASRPPSALEKYFDDWLREREDETNAATEGLLDAVRDCVAQQRGSDRLELFDGEGLPIFDPQDQLWHSTLPKEKPAEKSQVESHLARLSRSVQVALVTATPIELDSVLRKMKPLPIDGLDGILSVHSNIEPHFVGLFGEFCAVALRCEMGAAGAGGSILATFGAALCWEPAVVIMPGIAFGRRRGKQKMSDVLVAAAVFPYERQRVSVDEVIFRDWDLQCDLGLRKAFDLGAKWRFYRPDGKRVDVHSGLLLSGEKLVDNEEFRNSLAEARVDCLGGDMESWGLYAACQRLGIPCIAAKAICDWADGKKGTTQKKAHQQLAAAASVDLVHSVLSNPHALDAVISGER